MSSSSIGLRMLARARRLKDINIDSTRADDKTGVGIVASQLNFSYLASEPILRGVDLSIDPGQSVCIMGPSGAGKSTLLLCLGGLLSPTAGSVSVDGVAISGLSGDGLVEARRRTFGFVFQQSLLVPELTLVNNVALPLLAIGSERRQAHKAASEALARFDIDVLADKLPSQVSGGQAQRAAVARALVTRPQYLLADEPTGALDSANAELVVEALLSADLGATLVIVTHNPAIALRTDRTLTIKDGRIVG